MKNKRIIKKNFEFQEIIANKNFAKNICFVLYYKPNDKGYLRYGISVGKKIGNAVVRNKIKRQIRMIFNEVVSLYGDKSFDVIVIVRKAMLEVKFDTSSNALKKMIKNLNS
ncbi:ribonuclease P protein component [Mycoplasma putrefaciens]|uniref:Ribonuclease P protein component n=1 Tax=Mycoplasma putrefaciens (strain ATCC 15718 / NCTC 10155 / C30 KS-1 / KS-1) TaxID=743965 RepID=A0A7U4E9P1_MYCPK|nr:ribonuclease P protein component [Mycoplasma putrefaciens]AEM69057.1 ribonuclease P protein component [Mycoplasma putrefaciens KS1]SYV96670.1 ribonuclease P protein component [Mycoplasma putrefaciens]